MCDTSEHSRSLSAGRPTRRGGRPASLPTAPDAERHAAAEHQQRGLGSTLLFHSDARPAGSGAPAHRRAVSAADTGSAQRGGSDPPAARGNSAKVQGGVRDRLRRRAARLRGCRAQGRRYRFQAHAAARRARQGRKSLPSRKRGTAMQCCRHSCSNCCASGGGRGGGAACCCGEAGCFPAATRSNRCRPASSVVPSTPPPKPRGSRSASHHIRCGTASPRICSNKMSIFV